MADVQRNRPNIGTEELTGEMYPARETIGKLIDAIGTFNDAVSKVISLSNLNTNLNSKIEIMNIQELKQNHAELYNEVFNSGVAQERDRVESLMTFVDVDAAAVKTMVATGATPTQKFFAEMARKEASAGMVAKMETESAPAIVTGTAPEAKTEPTELERLEMAVLSSMNLQKQ
jgi:hypothetical protein